ncbi:heterokaryon incompatibility protein-domain-containing protein [Armillaria nabsnona]|nr:heterokaryon incompatibility protein-domain-containing protein [Armillaria nabsnona]
MTRLEHEAQAVSSDKCLSSHASCIPSVSPEIRSLVCESCWRTVFSVDSFHTAWVAQFVSTSPESAGFSYTTPAWEKMQHSIDLMCEWCDLVCEEIEFYYHHKTKTKEAPPADSTFQLRVRFMPRNNIADGSIVTLQLVIENSWSPTYLIHTAVDDQAARFILHPEVLLHVDSTLGYDLIKKCVGECLRHERCPPPICALLPTRVIDCTNPEQPHLFINQGIKDDYVALSYVWGEKQPHCTTTKILDSYIAGIPLQNIPKTIMDAIKVTQKLGLRFLWVDALCILQDSDDDKAQEIAQMRRIFRDAYVTIIAASAHKVSNGFLHKRSTWYPTASTLPFRCPDGGIGTMQLRGGQNAPKEPVNERAWCLEERVLSPRRVIYASHTLQYECQTTHINVNGAPNFIEPFGGIPRLPDRIFLPTPAIPSRDLPADEDVAKVWRNILNLYTQRTLTKPRDRLVALSGIVEQFHRFWSHTTYIAGLWEHQLPGCLLWYQGSSQCRTRPDRYRAPSWSWASMDGEVTMTSCSNLGVLCTIIQCNVNVAREMNPYGEVTAGSLVLDTILQPAVWDPVEGELFDAAGVPTGPLEWPELTRSDSGRGEIGYVVRDAIETVSERIGKVHLALISNTGKALLGLVLIPVTSQIPSAEQNDCPSFRRVGWFTAPFCDKSAWLSSSYQHIKVI